MIIHDQPERLGKDLLQGYNWYTFNILGGFEPKLLIVKLTCFVDVGHGCHQLEELTFSEFSEDWGVINKLFDDCESSVKLDVFLVLSESRLSDQLENTRIGSLDMGFVEGSRYFSKLLRHDRLQVLSFDVEDSLDIKLLEFVRSAIFTLPLQRFFFKLLFLFSGFDVADHAG